MEVYLYCRYTPSWRVRRKLYCLPSFIQSHSHCSIKKQRSSLQLAGTLYESRPSHRGFSQRRQTPRRYLKLGSNQLHPFKFVAHKHPATRLCSPVNELQSLNDSRITSGTSFAKLRPSTCSLTSRKVQLHLNLSHNYDQ